MLTVGNYYHSQCEIFIEKNIEKRKTNNNHKLLIIIEYFDLCNSYNHFYKWDFLLLSIQKRQLTSIVNKKGEKCPTVNWKSLNWSGRFSYFVEIVYIDKFDAIKLNCLREMAFYHTQRKKMKLICFVHTMCTSVDTAIEFQWS